jgi:hypothetical protein
MNDLKKDAREADNKARELWRKADGDESLGDRFGNLGDDVRDGIDNVGDDIREGADKAGDAVHREVDRDDRTYEPAVRDRS